MTIPLILRGAKGSKLTHPELDDNFTNLRTGIEAVDAKFATVDAIKLGGKSLTQVETDRNTAITLAIGNLINMAPTNLNTLKELADAIGNDPNFSATMSGALATKVDSSLASGWQQHALTQPSGESFLNQMGGDFDNYVNTGNFYIPSVPGLPGVMNTPTNLDPGEIEALLTVQVVQAGNFVKQEITTNLACLYVRTWYQGIWCAWRKVTM